MSVRYRIIHKESIAGTTTEYRADVLDSEYSGSVMEKRALDRFFDYEVEESDPREPLKNPVQKSSFTANLLFQSGDDISLINDIVGAEEGRFQIDYYINDGLQWSGTILTDISDYPEGPYPWNFRVTAKDLSVLETKDYPRASVATRTRLSVILAECFKQTGLDLPIRSFTNLTHSNANVNSAEDFIYALYHQKLAFQNKDTPFKYIDVLKHFCWAYRCVIRQAGGRWHIEQLPAVAKGDDKQFDYDSDGLNPTSSTPARAITVDRTDSFVLPNSKNKTLAALKELKTGYLHRTYIEEGDIPDITRSSEFDAPPVHEFSVDDLETGDKVTISVNASVTVDNPSGFMSGNAYMKLVGIRSGAPNIILHTNGNFLEDENNIAVSVGGSSSALTGSYSAEATIPTILFAPVKAIRLGFYWGDAQTSGGDALNVSQVTFTDIEVTAVKSERDWQASKENLYTQDGTYSLPEEIPASVLGDGPSTSSVGIPAYSNTTDSDLPEGGFQIRGVSEQVNLQEIMAREYMNMRRKNIRYGRYSLWMQYSAANLINYDGVSWFFLGGYHSAKDTRWDASLIAFDYLAAEGDKINEYTPDDSTKKPPFVYPGNDRGKIGELTKGVNGRVSEVELTLSTQVVTGMALNIEVEASGAATQVIVSKESTFSGDKQRFDTGKQTVPIIEQDIAAPAGTPVYFDAVQLLSILHKTPSEIVAAVEKEKTGESIGRLSQDLSGTVDRVYLKDIEGSIVVNEGTEYMLVNRFGDSELVTSAVQTIIQDGNNSLAIEETTLQYEYSKDYAWLKEPNYKISGRVSIQAGTLVLKLDGDGFIAEQRFDSTPDGESRIAFRADQVNFNTSRININDRVYIGKDLADLKADEKQILIGMNDPDRPFVHVRTDENNYVEMVARPTGDNDPFFKVISQGKEVFKVDRNGAFDIESAVMSEMKYKQSYEAPAGPVSLTDYVVSGKAALMIGPSGGTVKIGGFEALATGAVLPIINRGDADLVLEHQEATSQSANRIITPDGTDYTISPGHSATLIYDGTDDRWRFMSTT